VKTEEKACPSLNVVETHSPVKGGQAMPFQQSTDQSETQGEPKGSGEQEGMVVPWDLGALRLLKQPLQEDGRIEVEVLATTKRANCPHGQRVSVKVRAHALSAVRPNQMSDSSKAVLTMYIVHNVYST